MQHFIAICLLLSGTLALSQPTPKSKKTHSHPSQPTSKLASPVDPVCQMAVAETVADTAHYAGKHYGFCSKLCKERFKRQPTAYVKP
ncbi:YHS domain-containing protein [Fibrella sp. WM1]|uniref:YHS domain-containing protein n=1 Tax=Fibrella musci TaxID=3242485 RepID=UPI00351FE668